MNPAATSSPVQRLDWPDLAKGMAMILVVTGHVLGGLEAGHFIPDTPVGSWAYRWIYLFHVPALFFVSGWLLEYRTPMKGPPSLKSFAATLLYPYFLWGVILWAIQICGSRAGLTNVAANPWGPLRMLYDASAGPWFLLVLFLLHAVNHALQAVRRRQDWLVALSLGAFLVYACFGFGVLAPTLHRLEQNGLFYALGVWLAAHGRPGAVQVSHRAGLLLLGAVLLALPGWACWSRTHLPPLPELLLGFVGIAGLVCLSLGLAGRPGTRWLGWLGQQSLAIYVLHGFAPPVTRWLLTRHLGVTNPAGLLLAGVAAGLLTSACVAWAVNRWQLGWVFSLGRRPKVTGPR